MKDDPDLDEFDCQSLREAAIRASARAEVKQRVLEIINREAGKNWGHVGEALCDHLRERVEEEIGDGTE